MYKLTNIKLEDITSPIILIMPPNADDMDRQQALFNNGLKLAETKFSRRYDMDTLRAREDGVIEISLTSLEVEMAQTANGSVSFF